jgi:glycine dehydrogenase subunit 2
MPRTAPTRPRRRCAATSVKEIPTDRQGNVDLEALKAAVGPQTAGLMLTNPSTLGVFEKTIVEIQKIVHEAGGLSYYDGANLNAILGRVRPGDMGFDVIHMNLHKTFSTPHGGGGPGAGPVGVSERLRPFLPIPYVINERGFYRLGGRGRLCRKHRPHERFWRQHGRACCAPMSTPACWGGEGMQRVAEYAALNANYLAAELKQGRL